MAMQKYLVLCNFTDNGRERIKESPARLDKATGTAWKRLGCVLKDFYLLTGEYDIAIIVEAPDDRAATMLALSIGSRGALRAKVQRAYPLDEYREIIKALPSAPARQAAR
jgi:uncharacterized protein with GYD domain